MKQRKKNGQKKNKIKFSRATLKLSLTLQSFIKEGGLGLDPVDVGRGKQMQLNLPRYNILAIVSRNVNSDKTLKTNKLISVVKKASEWRNYPLT